MFDVSVWLGVCGCFCCVGSGCSVGGVFWGLVCGESSSVLIYV